MKSEVKVSGNRLEITRVFDAPRHAVFGWWTKPEKLQQWSGCREATKCEIEMDFRPGGSFTQKMQILAHGQTCEFVIHGVYLEITEPERIVYQANFGIATTRVTVEFFEHPAGTKLVLTHDGCPDEGFCNNISQGTTESFEKLDSLLALETLAPLA